MIGNRMEHRKGGMQGSTLPRANGPARRPAGLLMLVGIVVMLALALAGCGIGGSSSSSGTSIPLQILKGQNNATLAVAPVTINGHGPYPFIIDTGASVSLISTSLAHQLKLPRTSGRQPISGVGGSEQIVFVDVKNWKAGKVALPNTSIGAGALPSSSGGNAGGSNLQGLLGSDVWSQFGKITIDYGAARLTVYKSVAQSGTSGAAIARTGGELVVWRQAA